MDNSSNMTGPKKVNQTEIGQVRGTRLANKLGACPKATCCLLMWDKTVGQCLTLILSVNGSPTASPTTCHSAWLSPLLHRAPPPFDEKALNELDQPTCKPPAQLQNLFFFFFSFFPALWVKDCGLYFSTLTTWTQNATISCLWAALLKMCEEEHLEENCVNIKIRVHTKKA